MKKNVFLIFLLLAAFVLTGISCKTTPDGAAAGQPTGLRGAVSNAEEARKRAIDFESPDYFPSEWEEIEARNIAAGNLPTSSQPEIQQAVASYNALTQSYNELFNRTIPLYAQAREDEVLSTREQLIGSGFTNYFPEYLKNADDVALAALDQYEAEDYYTSKETAAKALDEYETLLLGSKVFLARQEVLDRGFRDYDPENFDIADGVSQAAIEAYDAGNKEAAISNAEEALLRYNIVLTNGWVSYSADRRVSATSERELALSERVNIASRDTFREGDALFNQAEENFAAENFNEAAVLYIDSEAIFAISRQETAEKRRRAEETIRLAEEKIEESSETASEAERIIEGGSR